MVVIFCFRYKNIRFDYTLPACKQCICTVCTPPYFKLLIVLEEECRLNSLIVLDYIDLPLWLCLLILLSFLWFDFCSSNNFLKFRLKSAEFVFITHWYFEEEMWLVTILVAFIITLKFFNSYNCSHKKSRSQSEI